MMAKGCFQLESNGSGNGNGTANVSCDMDKMLDALNPYEFNSMKDPVFVSITVTLYIIVILFGALGNTLVVVTVVKTKRLWNATNIFIANLAMADILVCVFDLPLNLYYQITDDWVFGKTMCHVMMSAFAVVVYTSTLTLTMIAIDRFILIVYPLRNRMSITVALLLVVVIAVVSMTVAAPIAIYASYSEVIQPDIGINWKLCGETWPNEDHRRLYTFLTLGFQFFVPLIIIVILYSLIFMKLRVRLRAVRSGQTSRKNKTTKMLVAVVTIFFITWIPFHLFALITDFSPHLVKGNYFKFADLMLRMIAMSSSCFNPLLYGWLNDNYRNAFLSIIKRPPISPAKNIRREDSECSRPPKRNNIGNVRVSPSKGSNCHVNGHGNKGDLDDRAAPEEMIPLQTVNNNSPRTSQSVCLDTTVTDCASVDHADCIVPCNDISGDAQVYVEKRAHDMTP